MPIKTINWSKSHNKKARITRINSNEATDRRSSGKNFDNMIRLNLETISCSERNDILDEMTDLGNLHENGDNENAKRLHFSAQCLKETVFLRKDSESSNRSCNSDDCTKDINVIDNLIIEIVKASQDGSLENVENKLVKLLEQSSNRYVALYLVKRNLLQNVMDALDGEPRWTKIFLRIIFTICFHDKANELISNDKNFANKILSHLASYDALILLELFKLLEFRIIRKIEQNPRSSWVSRIKEYGFFEHCIIVILNFSTDTLLAVTIHLLRSISQVNLIDRSNFLKNLFNMSRLIPALLTSYVRMIPEKKDRYSEIDLQFIDDWLTLITSITKHGFIFKNSENNENYIKLLKIICNILEPYQLPGILTSEVETGQNAYVIFKCMKLLSNFRLSFSVPLTIDRILMNISFRLKTALNSGGKNIESEKLFQDVLNQLHQYWLNIVELSSSLQILEIIYPCECDVREYLINAVYSESSDMAREKIRIINASFREKVFFGY